MAIADEMVDVICEKCGSDNVYYSKKRQLIVCEDCGHSFAMKKGSVQRACPPNSMDYRNDRK